MSGFEWPAVWATARALWPQDFGLGSAGVQAAWEAVLRDDKSFAPQLVAEAFRSMAPRMPKAPTLAAVVAECRERTEAAGRATVLALPAPKSAAPDSPEALVGYMRQDRARLRGELRDHARGLTDTERAARAAQIESVGAAEIALYRATVSGHTLSTVTLLEAAEHACESYPSIDDFLAHEAGQPAPDKVIDLPQGGTDLAVTPDPEPVAEDQVQREAEAIVAAMKEHGSRSIDWHTVPMNVRERCREIVASEKAAKQEVEA